MWILKRPGAGGNRDINSSFSNCSVDIRYYNWHSKLCIQATPPPPTHTHTHIQINDYLENDIPNLDPMNMLKKELTLYLEETLKEAH